MNRARSPVEKNEPYISVSRVKWPIANFENREDLVSIVNVPLNFSNSIPDDQIPINLIDNSIDRISFKTKFSSVIHCPRDHYFFYKLNDKISTILFMLIIIELEYITEGAYGYFPFHDSNRHKYRSVFVIYWTSRKIEQMFMSTCVTKWKAPDVLLRFVRMR